MCKMHTMYLVHVRKNRKVSTNRKKKQRNKDIVLFYIITSGACISYQNFVKFSCKYHSKADS